MVEVIVCGHTCTWGLKQLEKLRYIPHICSQWRVTVIGATQVVNE